MMSAILWARASLVAGVATTLGTAAHATAGGLLPGPVILTAIGGTLAVISAAALTAPASYLRIVTLVGGGQAAVHLALTVTAGHLAPHVPTAAPPVLSVPRARTGGVREQLTVVPDPDKATTNGAPGLQHLFDHLAGTDAPMMLAHLVAAAGVAWWLWRGEQSVWALLALLRGWVIAPSIEPFSGSISAMAAALPCVGRQGGCRREEIGSISRRGPPLLPILST